ncbi:MAG: hypothetical protein IT446_10235 [Phycisphaerales bacterium]|nr:hypothetical protein [Phycisphaerales bacterium]
MGFASGSVSFRRFAVMGECPKLADQELLDKLAEYRLQLGEFSVPDEVEYGWCGGRHILDGQFSFEHNVFADCLSFALRIDTNKVPGDLKKAYEMMEEEAVAAGNPSGFISKNQKRDVKESVRSKIEEELKTGRFRRSKLVSVLWDIPNQVIYSPATGSSAEKLMELFDRTFGLTLMPLGAGSLAMRMLEPAGRRRDYEDLKPSRFAIGPEGESQHPDYPWIAKGPEPKDFLGNEFLMWLWHESDALNGNVSTEAGEVTVMFERSIDLECAYGQTGKDALRGAGSSQSLEARDAARTGKVVRKVTMLLHAGGQQYDLSLNPETMAVGSGKLPEVEEAETPRVLYEERIALLRDLCRYLDGLYGTFIKSRASSAWEGHLGGIRRWIQKPNKVVAAA